MDIIKQWSLETECDFDKTIEFTDQDPEGFEEWVSEITYLKCRGILPDEMYMNMRIFIDNQGYFNAGSYRSYLLKRYNETLI